MLKYIIIVPDGMADYKMNELGNKTPLQFANTPTLDFLCKNAEIGLVKTVPETLEPGSDTANLSILGYNPKDFPTSRSPFEATNLGIPLSEKETVFRCNFVTLSEEGVYKNNTLIDHSGGSISSEESKELIQYLQDNLHGTFSFFPGKGYKNILVYPKSLSNLHLTPPHDIIGKKIGNFLPSGEEGEFFASLMVESHALLKKHPINIKRKQEGKKAANSIWFWGYGQKIAFPNFYDIHNIRGSIISAVDLIQGIGISIGLKVCKVPGATGDVNTNYEGKAEAALQELKSGQDLVYIHIEAPDECSHVGDLKGKIKAIENIDQYIVKKIVESLAQENMHYRMLVLPDHPTPLSLRTHTKEPVPFMLYESNISTPSVNLQFDEFSAKETGIYFSEGHTLIQYLFKK